jgi:transcriptional regulator with XRE-family HTH domain
MSTPQAGEPKKLHRLKEVRREQGITARRMAQHLRVDVEEVARQEDERTDLKLSELYAWQHILEVPVADLLEDSDCALSAPVMERARLVRLMKTAAAILERADTSSMRRLAETLIGQLTEIMPELEGITPWNRESHRSQRGSTHYEPRHVMQSEGWQEV